MNKITDDEIIVEIKLAARVNRVPKIIHRLLLYDESIPLDVKDTVDRFEKVNADFFHVLWAEEDIKRILTSNELEIYTSYTKNIQRADFARYIVLRNIGGIYVDLDVEANKSFNGFYETYKAGDLFFKEKDKTPEQIESSKNIPIRKGISELKSRVGNCVIMSMKNSDNIEAIINICYDRHAITVTEPYDILYTTGPDVVTTSLSDKIFVKKLSLSESDLYFYHRCVGHWRENKITI